MFNFRFSTEKTPEQLKAKVEDVLDGYGISYHADWRLSGLPFLTSGGRLLDAVKKSIKEVTGLDTKPSTAGGTSDGRFFAPTGSEVVELGVVNASIHKVDEHVDVHELELLSEMFETIIIDILSSSS
jgi:succinyl-diaminopimelate desuccinylase